MPTLFDLIRDPISSFIFALYGTLILWETAFPARGLPAVRGWKLRGLLAYSVHDMLLFRAVSNPR